MPVRALRFAGSRRAHLAEQQIHLAVLDAVEPRERRSLRGGGPQLEIARDGRAWIGRVEVQVMKTGGASGAPSGDCVVTTTDPRSAAAASATPADETSRVVFIEISSERTSGL